MFPMQGSNVVEDQDLLEIGILNSAHRQRLLQAIRLLPRVSTVCVRAFVWTAVKMNLASLGFCGGDNIRR